ncbi:hypothetical protein KC19_2G202400, partial [Ceratodon purpureus]
LGSIRTRRNVANWLPLFHSDTRANLRGRGHTLICPVSLRGHGSEHGWKRRRVVNGWWSVCTVLRSPMLAIHRPLISVWWITRYAVYHGTVSHSSRKSHLHSDREVVAATRRGEVHGL